MPGDHSSSDTAALLRLKVLLPLPLGGVYDYRAPREGVPPPGSFVVVPLGRRAVPGVVWDGDASGSGGGEVADTRLKPVGRVLDVPPMTPELRRFVEWVSAYTMAPPGAVLRMTMSVAEALEPPHPRQGFVVSERGYEALADPGAKLTETRRRLLEEAAAGPPRPAAELARIAGCGPGVVRGLVEAGFLAPVAIPARSGATVPDWRLPGARLSPDQAGAAANLVGKVESGGFCVTLLDGVTGSGKTEVYFAAIAAALEAGKQVLVLLPEIALSSQFLARFARRFGTGPVEWHSDLRPGDRRRNWRTVAEGRARVVVGARSALFLPFPELGLIIVDEEHESAFKQEEGVIYHARDMAVVRGAIARIPVVLVSATPSLETLTNVEQGRYASLHLPDRHGAAALPGIKVIDLRRHRPARQSFLSPPLLGALQDTVAAGEQALLFLNRRGYAPLTLCRACGHRFGCPNCTAWLVEHRFLGLLQCHHCGHEEPVPAVCPACGEAGNFAACGPGVERILEEVTRLFPEARIAVMASDTMPGPNAAAEMVRTMEERRIDILIGTQVAAKGHHFPFLTLVGVVDADLGLAGGDLRAAERTWQLLHQVAGRAGRAERPGTVYLQTFFPDHPVIRALLSGDRDRFLAAEAESRRRYGMPPFGRLAALILSGPDAESADFAAGAFARAVPHMPGVEVLGPAPAPLAVLRTRHRRRFLVKARRDVNLQAVLKAWLGRVRVSGAVRVQVDIDPYSFL